MFLISKRISVLKQFAEELKTCIYYDLAFYPLALLEDGVIPTKKIFPEVSMTIRVVQDLFGN